MAGQLRPGAIGAPHLRIDGPAKVRGEAVFAFDEAVANPAWAFLVTSPIARGRLVRVEEAETRALPGVLDVLTHANVGDLAGPLPGPDGGATTASLQSDQIWHDGQILAVVLAETFEIARDGAHRIRLVCETERPSASFSSPGVEAEPTGEKSDPHIGEAEGAFAAAPVKIDQAYSTPTQHHNAMELFATACAWRGDELLVFEPSQFVDGAKATLARQLKIPPEKVRFVAKFIGGAFGGKGAVTARTAWIAIAAKRLGRPVRLEATRDQGFTIATFRAETRHRVRLGADRQGKLQAVIHEGESITSRPSTYNANGLETTGRLYASPNVLTRAQIVHADRNTPGFMRAPPETPFLFPLEVAMDELAAALAMDPVELRRLNDTQKDPTSPRRYTSRSLVPCLERAAEAFGWPRRTPAPGSMREGEWLIGWGCASAAYPANIAAAACRLSLSPEGRARIGIAAEDLGTGTYTVLAAVVADALGLPIENVAVDIGDSRLPPAPISAGSCHASSVCNVAAKACEEVRDRLARAASAPGAGPLAGTDPARLTLVAGSLRAPDGRSELLAAAVRRLGGRLEIYTENLPQGAPPDGLTRLDRGQVAMSRGSERQDALAYAFGAQFVEVRVHERTREIRTPRAVGAFAAGTIIDPVTAKSQLMGGMIWGISAALHEKTEIDEALARYVNKDFSEYMIPVNADIGEVEVILVPEVDREVNPLGMKGIGEIGITGMNAAVANAVWHATGKRVRDLPIRLEDLL